MADAGGGFSNFADVAQHAARGIEDDGESEQNNGEPQEQEAELQAPDDAKFIALGEAEEDLTAVADANGGDAKGDSESWDADVGGAVLDNFRSLDGLQVGGAIACADPQFERAIAAGLKKEDGVVGTAVRGLLIGHLSRGQFGDFTDDGVIESVFRGALGDVAEDFDFAGKLGIAAALNISGNEALEKDEDHHGAAGEGESCPERDAPGGAAHGGLSGL
jgi:hypothetical protein